MRKNRRKTRKKAAVFLACCLAALTLFSCGEREARLKENGVLKVGMDLELEGLCYLSEESDKPEGLEVELAAELADRLGLELEIVDTTEENLLKSLDAGSYDCVLSGVGISDWNTRHYSRTEAYADISSVQEKTGLDTEFTEIAAFTKKGNPLAKELEEKLEELKKEDVLKELSEKYFETDITK